MTLYNVPRIFELSLKTKKKKLNYVAWIYTLRLLLLIWHSCTSLYYNIIIFFSNLIKNIFMRLIWLIVIKHIWLIKFRWRLQFLLGFWMCWSWRQQWLQLNWHWREKLVVVLLVSWVQLWTFLCMAHLLLSW